MLLQQDKVTGWWNIVQPTGNVLRTHGPDQCATEYCDIHHRDRSPDRDMPLNWRTDRGMMEVICECGIGHPSFAQLRRWDSIGATPYEATHGCCIYAGHCPGNSPVPVSETDKFVGEVLERYMAALDTKNKEINRDVYRTMAESVSDIPALIDKIIELTND